MWILFRVAMFFVGVAYRFFILSHSSVLRNALFEVYPNGVSLYVKNEKSKSGQLSSKVYLKIKSRLFFRIVPESSSLRWFKSMGWGQELQVGEKIFDDTFFIAAEGRGIITKLRGDSDLRAIFLKLHDQGFTCFSSDGFGHLLFENPNEVFTDSDELIQDFARIKNALEVVPASSFLSAPNAAGTLAFEIIGYGIAAYAISFQMSSIFDTATTHLNFNDYIFKGFLTVLALIVLWIALIIGYLRRSAFGLLLCYDFTLVYCALASVVGFLLFGDLNQTLDKSKKRLNIAAVENQFSETTGTGKSRRVYFYLILKYAKNPSHLPNRLAFSRSTYDNFKIGDGIEITVRKGFFNSPYIEGVRAIPSPELVSASTKSGAASLTYQRARDLARWIPTLNPKGELTGPVSWVEEKYPSGKIRQREPFVQNTRHGTATYWHENGVIYANINWRNGKKHGRVKISFPSGSIEQSLSYREGQLHGLCAWYDRDGQVTHMALYDNGDVISADMRFLTDIEKEMGGTGLR